MSAGVAVGVSESPDPGVAFAEAARSARSRLGGGCDLAFVFAAAPHLADPDAVLRAVHAELAPRNLAGCGAGGVLGAGRELEGGPGAVVWALSAPGAEIETHHVLSGGVFEPHELDGVPKAAPDTTMRLLADPYTFDADPLLARMNEESPGVAVLGGLASATGGDGSLFLGEEVLPAGAVACTISGIDVVPCVSQGAEPVGPEMTITACEGNVITELASVPAIERLRRAIGDLEPGEQALAASGLLLGIVIDENKPDYQRGDFLVRPIVGADERSGSIAVGESVRVGQTVRMHVRDPACADEDLREALRLQAAAIELDGAAGALLFSCNGRGSHMFGVPDHDVTAVEDALGAPTAGFFCAGEIGPVGGRNFLHGFTATMAVFPR
jgi:small ligand-binding sensory domain FIST